MNSKLRNLVKLDIGRYFFAAPLKELSWLRIGGPADLLVEPNNVDQVQNLMKALQLIELPYIVIGAGSNLLFDDAGFRGVVIKIGRNLSDIKVDGSTVVAKTGISVPFLIRRLGNEGLSGLEHAVGIPGTLGGLIVMNGGSTQKSISTHVDSVWVVARSGDIIEIDAAECKFGYRQSALQQNRDILIQARLRLRKGEPKAIRKEMIEILMTRKNRFPLKLPNCGSVFLSDPVMYNSVGPPGKIIEECGFKGLRVGDAMISNKHSNFIVNYGKAKSDDVLAIINKVRQGVIEMKGFEMKCEVRYVAPDGRIMEAHKALK